MNRGFRGLRSYDELESEKFREELDPGCTGLSTRRMHSIQAPSVMHEVLPLASVSFLDDLRTYTAMRYTISVPAINFFLIY